ncbi:MAG TPA: hypothetical protein VK338_01150, partial [Candidatus Nitrosocosmicus sp.]|nr:hypothetical protein [Candidatus Nitrosocosmicus sp.]
DHTLAESIPRYPNATNYRISSGSGFPDGVPSTEIYFQTNDSDDVVINWYISTLKKQGWKVVNRNDRKNDLKEANVEMWKINKNTIYTINVHKYDYSDNNAIRDKVSISVDHTFFREKMFKQME